MANVPYSPIPSVESGGGGGTPMSVRANPNNFGAQVSEQVEKSSDASFDLAQKQQGLINETQMVNGETALTQKLGALHGEYMSLSGTAAHDALPSYLQKANDAVQEIRGGIRGAAAIHGYDMLAQRRIGYVTNDWQGYAAGQVRKAQQESLLDNISAAQLSAQTPSIAADDHAFGEFVTGPIKHNTESMMDETQSGFKTDEDGRITFADTAEGKTAKVNFQANLDNHLGQAYVQRYDTLSKTLGPIPAYDKFQQDKENIPPLARVQIESSMQPKVFNAHAGSVVNTTMGEANQAHQESLLHPDLSQAIHIQESSGRPHDYQIQQGTFEQYAKPGESFSDPKAQDIVYRRIIDDLKTSYPNDPARSAVAYFSGKGNVSPQGSANPWLNDTHDKNGKSVSSYVFDVTKRMGYATNQNGSPVTPADYYQTHREAIISNGDAYAERVLPGNLEFRNAVRARLHQQMNDAIADQKGQYNQDNHLIMRAFNGDFSQGKKPMTWDDLNDIPGAKDVIDRASVHSPEFIRGLDTRLTSRSAGSDKDTKEYGKGFAELYKQIRPVDPTAPRLSDKTVLYKAFSDGELNSSGVEKLQSIMDGKQSLNPHEDEIRKQSLTFAKGQITGADEGLGVKDHKGNQLYLQYMLAADDMANKMHADGKTVAEIYDPKGPMGKLVESFKRPMAEWTADMTSDNDPEHKPSARTLADIVSESRLHPEKADELKKEAISLGFIRDAAHVPTPED